MKKATATSWLFILLMGALSGAPGCARKKTVWIYTNLPTEVIAEMDTALHVTVPRALVKWHQGTSPVIAEKLKRELSEGKRIADLVLISDPLWYVEAKKAGWLLPYQSPAAAEIPERFRDPDHAFVAMRVSVMVMAYHSGILKPGQVPETWKDLPHPQWKMRVSMGSPLEFGTYFTALSLLSRKYGWEYFAQLRSLNLMATGGSNAVIGRIETEERPLGIVLLENLLRAQARKSPVRVIYPLDGVIPIPGPIALLQGTKHPEVAQKVYDWFLGPVAQNMIVNSGIYSPNPKIVSPDNARPWRDLTLQLLPWDPAILSEVHQAKDQTRAKFSEIILR